MDTNALLERIKDLENQLKETKEHLKKYTAPTRSKTYYENHKEEILSRCKEDQEYKEKKKIYNRNSYLEQCGF